MNATSAGVFALFGRPLAHSLSPRIHGAFAAQLGLDITYRLIESGPLELAAGLEELARQGGRGANVTLPLKHEVMALCSELGDAARRCGSVNTLTRSAAGWRGDSTDGIGLVRDLEDNQGVLLAGRSALLLGAGGAASAAAFALLDAGVSRLAIANRTHARAQQLAQACGSRATPILWADLPGLKAPDLIIHATSAGHVDAALHLPASLVTRRSVCYDLSYGRAAAPFLAWAREGGAQGVHDGLGMLIEQAAASCLIWHGRRPDTVALHDALRGSESNR